VAQSPFQFQAENFCFAAIRVVAPRENIFPSSEGQPMRCGAM